MTVSDDTRLLIQILKRAYPWARFVSRSRGEFGWSIGTLRLYELAPEGAGIIPAGRCVELPPELLPEVPEGVMVRIGELEGKV